MSGAEDDLADYKAHGSSEDEEYEIDFEDAVEALRDAVLNPKEPPEVECFFQVYGGFVKKPLEEGEGEDPNFLSRIVSLMRESKKMRYENLEPYVKHIVENWPDLLRTPGKDGQTPIYRAIMHENHRLVRAMASCRDKKALEDALGYCSSNKKNCLHVAFEKNLDWETTRLLVGEANEKTLRQRDRDDGRTPAHYAVKFEQCLDNRVKTIRSLIERDLEFMENSAEDLVDQPTFLDEMDNSGASVYKTLKEGIESASKRYETQADIRRQQSALETRTAHQAEKPTAVGIKDSITKDTKSPRDRRTTAAMPSENERRNVDRLRGRHETKNVVDERERKRQEEKEREADQQKKKDLEMGRRKDGGTGSTEQRASEWRARDDGKVASEIGHDQLQSGVLSNTGVKRGDKALPEDRPPERKDGKKKRSSKMKPIDEFMNNFRCTKENSERILLELKLHYLRTRNTEKSLTFIYGINKDNILLSFDYEQLPRTIDWGRFVERFGDNEENGIQFDKVLKRVAFPVVSVRHRSKGLDAVVSNPVTGTKGRQDMESFFGWLQRKGVRHILQLEVEDLGTTEDTRVHTDLSIRTCLQGFVVEHLDWRKLDLNPEVILRIDAETRKPEANANASGLRELTLQWSGNSAILRTWSDPEILDMLPNLKYINLTRPLETVDGPEWIDSKVKDFKARLEARNIEPTAKKSSHQWIESIDRFTDRMERFWQDTLGDFDEMRKGLVGTNAFGKVKNDVVVALIDDGIDLLRMNGPDDILVGKSFDFKGGEARPWYTSAKDHGTAMAQHILQVCPMAKIYPIRLRTYQATGGRVQIDGRDIARAIEAALEQNAAVISISWSTPLPRDMGEEVREAMTKARNQHVLIFCSVPDHGNYTENHELFPAELYRKDVILIGAADSNGTRWEKTHQSADFYLPGVDVSLKSKDRVPRLLVPPLVTNPGGSRPATETPVSSQPPQPQNVTGSSIATALGAGLAALLIYSTKAAVLAVWVSNEGQNFVGQAVQPEDVENLNIRENMMAAFSSLGLNVSTGYIEVWKELDKLTDAMSKVHHPGWQRCTTQEKKHIRKTFLDFVDNKLKKRG